MKQSDMTNLIFIYNFIYDYIDYATIKNTFL